MDLLLVDEERRAELVDQLDDVATVDLEVPGSVVRRGDGIDESVGQGSLQSGKHGYVTTEAGCRAQAGRMDTPGMTERDRHLLLLPGHQGTHVSPPGRSSRRPSSSTTTASPGSTSRAPSSWSRTSEGNILEAFTPDFYLPDLDLFIEVTEMKQSLVTAKNRKVRKLREKYPEVRIKLLYRKDFVRLAQKYGL